MIAEICHLLLQTGRLYSSQKVLRLGCILVAHIAEHSEQCLVTLHNPESQSISHALRNVPSDWDWQKLSVVIQ